MPRLPTTSTDRKQLKLLIVYHTQFGGTAQMAEAAFAGQPDAIDPRPRLRAVRGVDDEIHLPPKCAQAAKRFRIEHLHEYRRAPALRRVGAAESRQPARQRFDQQAKAETLVAGVESAERQLADRLFVTLDDPRRALAIAKVLRELVGISTSLGKRVQHAACALATLRAQRRLLVAHGGRFGD
jgi:hypothetical protein